MTNKIHQKIYRRLPEVYQGEEIMWCVPRESQGRDRKNQHFGGIPKKGQFWAFWEKGHFWGFCQNGPFWGKCQFWLFWAFWGNWQIWAFWAILGKWAFLAKLGFWQKTAFLANLAKTAKMGKKVKSWKTANLAISADLPKMGYFSGSGNLGFREILQVEFPWKQHAGCWKYRDFRFYRVKTGEIWVLQGRNPVLCDHR